MVKNARSMLKIPYTGRPGLYPTISMQFTLEMCTTTKYCKKH